jgi:hypothetical protein
MTPQLLDAFLAEIAESAAPIPSVYFNFGHVIFSPGIVWIPSTPQPVAVLNGGDASLTISGILITGPGALMITSPSRTEILSSRAAATAEPANARL